MIDDAIRQNREKVISKLTEARLEKGLSQAKLAKLIGTQRSNICRIESGSQNLSLDMVLKIADALGKEVEIELEEKSKKTISVYQLRLYDEELCRFSLTENGIDGLQAEILSVNESRKHLLPLDLTLTETGIVNWLERRVLPRNRAFADVILNTLGLSMNNTKGIIDVCMGLSLNDSFWVVPTDFEGSFSENNCYLNRFSEALSLVAYTGVKHSNPKKATSPELTTHGILRKAWRYIEGEGVYLYKGGTYGAANAGNEPYSEFYACQIAEQMGLNAVHYDLEHWKGVLASKCLLFTDIDTAFIPIGRVVPSGGIRACLEYFKAIDEEAYEHIKSMLVFDAVIYNEDRHFGNFGVLRDNHTGKLIGAAPIFDNGISLFNYAMPNDFTRLDDYAKTRSTPYGVPYESICRELAGSRQHSELRSLMEFRFARHPSYNLPEYRLIAIERQIRARACELLSL